MSGNELPSKYQNVSKKALKDGAVAVSNTGEKNLTAAHSTGTDAPVQAIAAIGVNTGVVLQPGEVVQIADVMFHS
jgi:hypothetical protein